MSRIKINSLKIKAMQPFEHLDFVMKNTTPSQRFQWLEQAWNLWYQIRKTSPKRIAMLQDKFREGKI